MTKRVNDLPVSVHQRGYSEPDKALLDPRTLRLDFKLLLFYTLKVSFTIVGWTQRMNDVPNRVRYLIPNSTIGSLEESRISPSDYESRVYQTFPFRTCTISPDPTSVYRRESLLPVVREASSQI